MKFDFFHCSSTGDEISKYQWAILDWNYNYYIDYKFRSSEGFSGKYNKVFWLHLELFRYFFRFEWTWGHKQTTPEDAKLRYRKRFKRRETRDVSNR